MPDAMEMMVRSWLRRFGVEPVLDQAIAMAKDGTIEKIVAFADGIEEHNKLLREILHELKQHRVRDQANSTVVEIPAQTDTTNGGDAQSGPRPQLASDTEPKRITAG